MAKAKTKTTNEMVALNKANELIKANPEAAVLNGASSESKLDEGTYEGTLLGGSTPFKATKITANGQDYILTLAKFNVNFNGKTIVQEGSINLEEWEDDILNGISLSNQEIEIEAKPLGANSTMRNIITRA